MAATHYSSLIKITRSTRSSIKDKLCSSFGGPGTKEQEEEPRFFRDNTADGVPQVRKGQFSIYRRAHDPVYNAPWYNAFFQLFPDRSFVVSVKIPLYIDNYFQADFSTFQPTRNKTTSRNWDRFYRLASLIVMLFLTKRTILSTTHQTLESFSIETI